jgi:hypothetical protein
MANHLHPDIHKLRWLRLETRATSARLAALENQQAAKRREGYASVETAHLVARMATQARASGKL